MAKKNSGFGGVAIVIGLVVAGLASIPREVWIGIGVLAAVVVVVYLYRTFNNSADTPKGVHADQILRPIERTAPEPAAAPPSTQDPQSAVPKWDAARTWTAPARTAPTSYGIPPAPSGYGQASWVPRGQSITVGGLTIPGGMLYFGTSLKTQ